VRRGFKTDAEQLAERVRREMGLRVADPLRAIDLAEHLGLEVRCADELVSADTLRSLDGLQPGVFSACTFSFPSRRVIVYNPLNSVARTQSDVAHEVSHILLDHETKEIHQIGSITFFTCDPDEEQEANWLAGCVLLPRRLLLTVAKRGWDAQRVAVEYQVSEQMAAFRMRATGVLRQLRAS